MSGTPLPGGETGVERDHTRVYLGVIVIEVLVLAGIWLVQRYFGS